MEVVELAHKMRQEHDDFVLLDVRNPPEREFALIEPSRFIPLHDLYERVDELQDVRDKTIIVYCHSGIRSMMATQILRQLDFPSVENLEGGIDAWSCEVDSEVPRY